MGRSPEAGDSGRSEEARLRDADLEFWLETGKTPQQESDDSVRMLGGLLLFYLVLVVVGVAWALSSYLW